MVLNIDDWIFDVDLKKTMEYSSLLSADHCCCGYCVNYYLAIYPVQGRVLQFGCAPIMVGGTPVTVEFDCSGTFKLEVGYIPIPWLLKEPMDEVVSPANEPEFLEKMYRKALGRSAGSIYVPS